MDIREVQLPGIGLRYEFATADRDRLAIIAKRTGDFEVYRYDNGDPDAADPLFRLTGEEAEGLAQILGAPRIVERFAELTREVSGIDAGQIRIRPGTAFVDRPLGESQIRTRTGASIVAVLRGEAVLPSPMPADVLRAGDVLVVIGTEAGLTAAEFILDRG